MADRDPRGDASIRPAGVGETLRSSLPLLWGLLRSREVPRWKKVAGIAAPLLYVLVPVDVLPDVIPLAGRVDDAGVWLGALLLLARSVPTGVVERTLAGRRRFGPRRARAVALALRDPRRAGAFLVVGTAALAVVLTALTVLVVVAVVR